LPALQEHYGDFIKYVQKGDIKGMSRAVIDLLRNYDYQLATTMKLGMKKAEEYSWENIARRMLEIIIQKLFR